MAEHAVCAVCGLRIRRVDATGLRSERPLWVHDDSRYDLWQSPVHAAQPEHPSAGNVSDEHAEREHERRQP